MAPNCTSPGGTGILVHSFFSSRACRTPADKWQLDSNIASWALVSDFATWFVSRRPYLFLIAPLLINSAVTFNFSLPAALFPVHRIAACSDYHVPGRQITHYAASRQLMICSLLHTSTGNLQYSEGPLPQLSSMLTQVTISASVALIVPFGPSYLPLRMNVRSTESRDHPSTNILLVHRTPPCLVPQICKSATDRIYLRFTYRMLLAPTLPPPL